MTRTLVLGGGGVTGVAWELGVLEGLRRAGVDLSDADVVIGTSAGSVVGTRLRLGPIDVAYDEQTLPATGELTPAIGRTTMIRLGIMLARRGEPAAKLRKVGKAALKAHPESADARRDVMRSRIGEPEWPAADLRITAIDIGTGELVVFDRSSGVSLLDAVTASCAVPLVWPPVVIGSTTYIDGGVRSPANADLATGAERIVVLAPLTRAMSREHAISVQLERTGASASIVVAPDAEAEVIMGDNSLDPEMRPASAVTGLRQGALAAEAVAAAWNA
ncbi:MAG: patatin-like phospholipase family protein [Marmoricola sp.]|nr:patatin-like phospholipase family protein [Marmoricola sp.]